jgi:hypothetical protein
MVATLLDAFRQWQKSWMLKILFILVQPENQREWYITGYMVYAYTFKNVFNYEDNDIWCTADIGWITGHSIH